LFNGPTQNVTLNCAFGGNLLSSSATRDFRMKKKPTGTTTTRVTKIDRLFEPRSVSVHVVIVVYNECISVLSSRDRFTRRFGMSRRFFFSGGWGEGFLRPTRFSRPFPAVSRNEPKIAGKQNAVEIVVVKPLRNRDDSSGQRPLVAFSHRVSAFPSVSRRVIRRRRTRTIRVFVKYARRLSISLARIVEAFNASDYYPPRPVRPRTTRIIMLYNNRITSCVGVGNGFAPVKTDTWYLLYGITTWCLPVLWFFLLASSTIIILLSLLPFPAVSESGEFFFVWRAMRTIFYTHVDFVRKKKTFEILLCDKRVRRFPNRIIVIYNVHPFVWQPIHKSRFPARICTRISTTLPLSAAAAVNTRES